MLKSSVTNRTRVHNDDLWIPSVKLNFRRKTLSYIVMFFHIISLTVNICCCVFNRYFLHTFKIYFCLLIIYIYIYIQSLIRRSSVRLTLLNWYCIPILNNPLLLFSILRIILAQLNLKDDFSKDDLKAAVAYSLAQPGATRAQSRQAICVLIQSRLMRSGG